jgi:hypothetical protein
MAKMLHGNKYESNEMAAGISLSQQRRWRNRKWRNQHGISWRSSDGSAASMKWRKRNGNNGIVAISGCAMANISGNNEMAYQHRVMA